MAAETLEAPSTPAVEALIEAAAQLDDPAFQSVLTRLLLLNAAKRTALPAEHDAELLRVIRQTPAPAFQRAYRALQRKRDAATLTPAEHAHLMELSQQLEQKNVLRYAALDALAKRRGVSWDALIAELRLKPLMP